VLHAAVSDTEAARPPPLYYPLRTAFYACACESATRTSCEVSTVKRCMADFDGPFYVPHLWVSGT